jgi:hypothetical protein
MSTTPPHVIDQPTTGMPVRLSHTLYSERADSVTERAAVDPGHLHHTLSELARTHRVPGAQLAIYDGGETVAIEVGELEYGTGRPLTRVERRTQQRSLSRARSSPENRHRRGPLPRSPYVTTTAPISASFHLGRHSPDEKPMMKDQFSHCACSLPMRAWRRG